MAANMYRVGDYVYFENSSSNPYLIRRIEELSKANGNVEAKVVCLFRKRDLPSHLSTLADNSAKEFEEDSQQPPCTESQKHQLKHRELFLSRQFESLPATHIRGKCNVTLLNETDLLTGYLEKEDSFFYSLVFDPAQKTLLADQGEIRVGSKYQAEIPDRLAEGESDGRVQEKLETKVWDPDNQLKDSQIDQFLVVARAVGTFARALDCSSSIRQPSLHMSAAAASRDVTLFHAMDTLQRSGYDLAQAMTLSVIDIRQDFLPWKSLASIVQFYYMWKTTDRYIQQKRLKAAEADSKLKQVYIPTYTKPNPNQIMAPGAKPGMNGSAAFQKILSCESCFIAQSPQWYAWGPSNMQCRLCASCWIYWKKYGGLKTATQLEGAARPSTEVVTRGQMTRQEVQDMSPFASSASRAKLLAKNRQTFILQTTKLSRVARRVCRDVLQPRRAARRPYVPINSTAVKAECMVRLAKPTAAPVKVRALPRADLATIVKELAFQVPLRLKAPGTATPAVSCNQGNHPAVSGNQGNLPTGASSLLGKRPFDSVGGVNLSANGRPFTCGLQRNSQSPVKRPKLNHGDSPTPVVFVATKYTRSLRKALTPTGIRRAARKPYLPVKIKTVPPPPTVLPPRSNEPIVLED
ncbi:hypothetical protein GJAV_G00126590 [Gymnothorax javanicus]|nr:hypothetical protein GJAV_G00126590 [Gymnothorax javanicus]